MNKEEWRNIKDYEGLYQVSNLGRVKSLGRKNYSNVCLKDKILNPQLDRKNGYKRVCLCKNKKEKRIGVHRLVAQAFISNLENKPFINHKNGNKLDNRIENLEWCTAKENTQHAIKTGLINTKKRIENMKKIGKIGYKNNCKKVNQYDFCNNFIKQWLSIKEASEKLNVSNTSISNCINGKSKSAGGYIWKLERIKDGKDK